MGLRDSGITQRLSVQKPCPTPGEPECSTSSPSRTQDFPRRHRRDSSTHRSTKGPHSCSYLPTWRPEAGPDGAPTQGARETRPQSDPSQPRALRKREPRRRQHRGQVLLLPHGSPPPSEDRHERVAQTEPGRAGTGGHGAGRPALGTEQLSRAFTRRQAGKVERALQGRPSTKVPAGAQRGRQRHSEDGTRSQNEARGQRSPQSLNWGGGQRGRKVKVCRGSPCPPSAETLPLTHAAQGGSTAPCGFHVKELWQQNQQQRKEW